MWKRLQIWKQRSGSRPRANRPFRPRLEILGDRVVPAIITVNNPSDTAVVGETNLRQAITQANATGTGDVINIAVSGTDVLGADLPAITATNTTINVTAGNFFTVSGAGTFRDFSVAVGGQVVVNGNNALTFTGGLAADGFGGGGIRNAGTLTLNGTTVTGNTATSAAAGVVAVGGGINNSGNLTLSNDTVSDNTARITGAGNGVAAGGGIGNVGGTVTGTNVTVSGNVARTDSTDPASFALGGGIVDQGASFSLSNSTVSGNTANTSGAAAGAGGMLETAVGGGGIGTVNDPSFKLNGVTIIANEVQYTSTTATNNFSIGGGGLFTAGTTTATVTNCMISNNIDNSAGNGENGGGGIFNSGTLVLVGSTVSGNSVTNATAPAVAGDQAFGGAILDLQNPGAGGGVLRATNDTIWANSASATGAGATATGGGLRIGGGCTATLVNVTVGNNTATGAAAGSTGGGISDGGTLQLVNTIVSDPFGPAGSPDVFTQPAPAAFEAQNSDIASTVGFTITTDRGGNLRGVAPSLGPLADNGGPTLTVAELPGSPTINAGATASPLGAIPTADQRGFPRASGVDIGAFEVPPPPPPTPAPAPAPPPVRRSASLITKKVGKGRHKKPVLFVQITASDGRAPRDVRSPFQKPAFKNIQVKSVSATEVVLTAKKGKKTVTATVPA
jgi:hypothetical protein